MNPPQVRYMEGFGEVFVLELWRQMIFGFELVTPLQVDPAFVSIKIEGL